MVAGTTLSTLELIVRSLPTIMNVTPLAPADRHGMKPGDVIFLVDGELASAVGDIDRPPSHSETVRMIDALTPGDSTFEVIRNCEFQSIDTCRTERCSLGVIRENGITSWSPHFLVVS